MKIANIMNFVRQIDERFENSTEKLLEFTAEQLRLINEYSLDNTFLLQYDALCDDNFTELFKREATERTELGLWYEIVEPLASACGIPYNSENGWKWDWHIVPGFSMAYTPAQRELLIDEAMRKFRAVFGYYPKTVASWLIDTHTLNYLARNYDISAVAICRDQANTDAYTLLGGYFNQAYYPSINNIFTPAQSKEMQTGIPVFRLLGPCPIHNYDNHKYSSEEFKACRHTNCFTLEPRWYIGSHEDASKWLFDSYYGGESLGFSYAHIGQENSFFRHKEQIFDGLRMQIELLIARGDVDFKKMGETGDLFKKVYPAQTPATAVTASSNFDSVDVESVYYDCKNYTANLFRFEDKIFFRSIFLFDERIKDLYLEDTCTTFDAIYENLPIVDTVKLPVDERNRFGLEIDGHGLPFATEKLDGGVLRVRFGEGSATFYEDRIEIIAHRLIWHKGATTARISLDPSGLDFEYKGSSYRTDIVGAEAKEESENIVFRANGEKITLFPKKK